MAYGGGGYNSFIPDGDISLGPTIEYSRPKQPKTIERIRLMPGPAENVSVVYHISPPREHRPLSDLLDCTPSPVMTLWDDRRRLEELFPDKGDRLLSARKAK